MASAFRECTGGDGARKKEEKQDRTSGDVIFFVEEVVEHFRDAVSDKGRHASARYSGYKAKDPATMRTTFYQSLLHQAS